MTAITVEASRELWLAKLKQRKRQSVENIPLIEAAGRILAADLRAKTDIPAFRKSPYDGFVIAYDTSKADEINQRFKIIGCIGAGETFSGSVGAGEAVRIMTGAPIPDDCDTMIMQERCIVDGQYMTVSGEIRRGDNIVPQGEECLAGERILLEGMLLDGAALSVAAGLGYDVIPVFERLKIVLLTSGREIIPLGQLLKSGQIYNSNYYLLTNLLREHGFTDIETYHVSDAPEMIHQEIEQVRRLSADADVIISTGGVSVGAYDYMPHIYRALGAVDLYTRINMRPGAASYGGLIERKNEEGASYTLCFGLSGNPAAAFNGFYLLALPVLRYCQGFRDIYNMIMELPLESDINKHNPFDRFVQGQLVVGVDGQAVFRPNALLTSSALLGLSQVTGLAKLDQGRHVYKAGKHVRVTLLKMPH